MSHQTWRTHMLLAIDEIFDVIEMHKYALCF